MITINVLYTKGSDWCKQFTIYTFYNIWTINDKWNNQYLPQPEAPGSLQRGDTDVVDFSWIVQEKTDKKGSFKKLSW